MSIIAVLLIPDFRIQSYEKYVNRRMVDLCGRTLAFTGNCRTFSAVNAIIFSSRSRSQNPVDFQVFTAVMLSIKPGSVRMAPRKMMSIPA